VFKRSFVLSRDLDTPKIDAALKSGVLTLTVPKIEHAKPRRIPVRSE
jgi:HSP20 family protein